MGESSAGLSVGRVRASVSPAKCDAFQGPLCDAFPRRTLCLSPASHQPTQGKRTAAVRGAERVGAAFGLVFRRHLLPVLPVQTWVVRGQGLPGKVSCSHLPPEAPHAV